MLQTVKKHLAKLSNYPRLRIFLIIVAIIIVFVILMNLLTPSSSKQDATPPSQVQSVGTEGGKTTSAPANQTSQYQSLASADQAASEKQAIQSGGSVFQNAIQPGQNTSTDTTDSNNNGTPNSGTTASTPQQQAARDALSQQIATLQQQLNAQQSQQNQAQQAQMQQATGEQMQNIQSAMRSGIQNVADSWKLPTLTTVEGSAPAATSSSAAAQGSVAIKAGTIIFGVIDTALDSDQPGTPVLATIVTGPYKGAKLIGAFVAQKNALVVRFNLMSIPSLSSSISIDAFAIDEATANNAIASDVNNHYLLRYGMLLASAFLQGFGTAYQNYSYCNPGAQNCSVINTNGNNNLPNNTVTAKNAAYQGLGQVGTTLSQAAAAQFNTPPTITVNQGTGIGVLFNSDVRIPINQS